MGIDQDGELVGRLGAIRDWMELDGSGADADAIGAAIARLSADPPRPAAIVASEVWERVEAFASVADAELYYETRDDDSWVLFSFGGDQPDHWTYHPASTGPAPRGGNGRATCDPS